MKEAGGLKKSGMSKSMSMIMKEKGMEGASLFKTSLNGLSNTPGDDNSAQNSTDPLFLHLRIMTNEITTINLIAKYLSDIFNN